jgi:hypothetical protein
MSLADPTIVTPPGEEAQVEAAYYAAASLDRQRG